MFLGDFNEVVKPEERKGGVCITSNIREYRESINEMELIDLPLIRRKYTRFRGRSWSRLDQILVEFESTEELKNLKVWGC